MLKHFLTLLFILASLCPPAQAIERRVALVIGNAGYRDAPLGNPLNDARDMAAALRQTGFEVIELIDGTQKEMNRAIARFGDRLSADAIALFYYAGHGMQVRGKNYLIPVDAQITNETSIRVESVDVDGVLDQLGSSELNVVILDACRNNPFERRFRSLGGGGLAQMDAPKGSLIAYATSPGKTAADGDGRNGMFTQALLKQMQVPGLTIEQVFKNVRREVARATRDNQIPWESSSLTGDFYFLPANRLPVAVNPPPARAPEAPPVAAATPRPEAPVRQAPVELPVAASAVAAAPAAARVPAPAELPPAAPKAPAVEPAREQVIKTASFTVTGKIAVDPASGAMTGEATIEWLNGDRYQGSLLAGQKHGKGAFTWGNGQRYDGEWAGDMINGHGTLRYANGDRYEGDFRNGEPHGQGTYTLRNGDIYLGSWANGNKHGQGRLTWVNGDYWEGEFRDDRQTDNGRLILAGASADEPEDKPEARPAAKPVKALAQKKGK